MRRTDEIVAVYEHLVSTQGATLLAGHLIVDILAGAGAAAAVAAAATTAKWGEWGSSWMSSARLRLRAPCRGEMVRKL